MPFITTIIVALVSIVLTALVTVYVRKTTIEKKVGNAEEKAREIIDDALKVAERSKREALLEAKENCRQSGFYPRKKHWIRSRKR